MILSKSIVDLIYDEVGFEKSESLLKEAVGNFVRGATASGSINHVLDVIKKHQTITKVLLIKECSRSQSTVNHSVNALLASGEITKSRERNVASQPVTYTIKNKV